MQSGLQVTEQLERIEDRETIRTLISQSAKYLDDRRYKDFIELFVEKGKYILEAESDEIGQRMIWLETSRDELAELLEESSQHVHDLAERIHLVSMDELTFDNSREDARASSAFSVFRTDTAGVTQVYAVGRYDDRLERSGDVWRIRERRVKVQTRMFRTPTPTPL